MATPEPAYPSMAHLLSPSAAAKPTPKSPATLRRWARKYPGVGIKVGGTWMIDPAAVRHVLEGRPLSDLAALDTAA